MKWISGHGRYWHLARERESVGVKTGKVYSRYLVAACSGKSLGGAWGAAVVESEPEPICPRCKAIMAKEAKCCPVG